MNKFMDFVFPPLAALGAAILSHSGESGSATVMMLILIYSELYRMREKRGER